MMMTWFGVASVPVILAVVELLKLWGLDKKYAAVAAVVLGIAGGIVAYVYAGNELAEAVFQGLLAGLTAVGVYSGVKNTTEGLRGE